MALEVMVDTSDHDKLVEAMAKVPERAEKAVNEALWKQGGPAIMASILGLMPVGARDRVRKRKKAHAKHSNSLKVVEVNLGVIVKRSAKRWNYLIFPNDGIGKRNPRRQEFFERGLEREEDKVMNMMLDALEKESL